MQQKQHGPAAAAAAAAAEPAPGGGAWPQRRARRGACRPARAPACWPPPPGGGTPAPPAARPGPPPAPCTAAPQPAVSPPPHHTRSATAQRHAQAHPRLVVHWRPGRDERAVRGGQGRGGRRARFNPRPPWWGGASGGEIAVRHLVQQRGAIRLPLHLRRQPHQHGPRQDLHPCRSRRRRRRRQCRCRRSQRGANVGGVGGPDIIPRGVGRARQHQPADVGLAANGKRRHFPFCVQKRLCRPHLAPARVRPPHEVDQHPYEPCHTPPPPPPPPPPVRKGV